MALFVTAHPDDEAMFFAPSILALVERGLRVALVCLSTGARWDRAGGTCRGRGGSGGGGQAAARASAASSARLPALRCAGDANSLGKLRVQELRRACVLLGVSMPAPCVPRSGRACTATTACAQIAADDVMVVDDPQLRDGMRQRWPPAAVARHVAHAVHRFSPHQVYTFDVGGVSGHPNHVATCAGVLQWWAAAPSSSSRSSLPEVWQLETVALPRKYVGPVDAPVSRALLALRRWQRRRQRQQADMRVVVRACPGHAWRALLAHVSQMVW